MKSAVVPRPATGGCRQRRSRLAEQSAWCRLGRCTDLNSTTQRGLRRADFLSSFYRPSPCTACRTMPHGRRQVPRRLGPAGRCGSPTTPVAGVAVPASASSGALFTRLQPPAGTDDAGRIAGATSVQHRAGALARRRARTPVGRGRRPVPSADDHTRQPCGQDQYPRWPGTVLSPRGR